MAFSKKSMTLRAILVSGILATVSAWQPVMARDFLEGDGRPHITSKRSVRKLRHHVVRRPYHQGGINWYAYRENRWEPGITVPPGSDILAAGAVAAEFTTGYECGAYAFGCGVIYPTADRPPAEYYSTSTVCTGRSAVYDKWGFFIGYKKVRVPC